MTKKIILIMFIIAIIFFNINTEMRAQNNDNVYSYSQFVTNSLKYTYKNLISPINQGSCSMYPTCSLYAAESFEHHNPFIAWLKTSDRLIRCSNDPNNYNTTLVNGMTRFYDPINYKNGDFNLYLNKNHFITLSENLKKDKLEEEKAKLLFEFAERLKYEGEIDKAIIEHKRLINYYPESNYKFKSLRVVFSLLSSEERYIEAIEWGKMMIESEDIFNIDEINFNIAILYFRLENHEKALHYFEEVRKSNNLTLISKTFLLEGLSYVINEKWEEANKTFSRVPSDSQYYENAQSLIQLSKEGRDLKLKNSNLAGALSIVPGLGYLYSGYNQTALSSFFVNSLFIWATYQSFEKGNKGLGTLLGVFTFGFYSGNIYGSIQSANRQNELIKQEHIYKFNLEFNF